MINAIISEKSFIVILLIFVVGAIGSLCFKKKDTIVNAWQSFFAIAGSVCGLVFSVGALITTHELSFFTPSIVTPLLSFSFHIDALSAFFVFIISLITLFSTIYGVGYIKHYYKKYSIGALGFFYNLFIVGMLVVVTASNGLFFLIAWEIMSIASYFLVIYDRNDKNNIKAGFLYLVMTHIGTAFIILAFLLMYKFTGSFDFASISAASALIPSLIKDVIFILALIGFGTKSGIIPFHIWLPSAHPAAPSHVSALMSGVMIKTGIYMMIRVFLGVFQSVPLWWGVVVLVIGSVSALLGVLYALTEHDIKRLLAYHSIENIGIILLGLGSSLVFASFGNTALALFGLGAALFHTLNHATFKSLLFLSAGSVINQTHTRNMEECGGLIKHMPQTALFFLVGSMAISALPPFNGFFSEWMTFQMLLQGILAAGIFVKTVFVLAVIALAITGGLALACFVKAFGVIFLARPRSEEMIKAKESSKSLIVGMGSLATLCLFFGVFSGYIGSLLTKIGSNLSVLGTNTSSVIMPFGSSVSAPKDFGSISAPAIFFSLILAIIVITLLVKFVVNKKQVVKTGSTWDCGVDLTPRMEITATGFARSIMLIFSGILKPTIQHEIEYQDSETRYLPKATTIRLSTRDIYRFYFYEPLKKFVTILSLRAKSIQSGNINMYVLYILVTVAVTLFLLK